MTNKGFTLIELLAVLALLVIIFMLIYPSVNDILARSEKTVYQTQVNNILNAAYDFSLKNSAYLPEYNSKTYITLGELKYEGLIDTSIKNPHNNENFNDNLVISIHNVGSGYNAPKENAKLEGNYLYTLEIDRIIESKMLPKITLEGLTPNSDGNYIITLDLNDEYNDYKYTATSYDEINLTERVKKYVLLNGISVENIDSSKVGIYKVYYSVIDDNGYATSLILNIIVVDSIAPEIYLPADTVISKDVTNYDLLSNVECEDNSGFCDIETSGEIDYGVTGKYIIKYTAKDQSGNTNTKERVIEIE